MKLSKRKLALGLLAGAVAVPAWAQLGALGGLMGGGRSGGGSDPKKLEEDLKGIIESTSLAMGKLAEAMGLKETSARMQKNAADIKSGAVGLADSTSLVSDASAEVKAEMEKNQREGTKLDAASSTIATQALEPAIKSFPRWKSVADGFKSLDRTALLGAASLAQAIPKVPTAAKSTLEMYQAGITYLTFSGADTTSVKQAAESALKF